LTKGDSVEIIVSKGITTTPETVPSVVNQNVTNAISDLKTAKLVYKIVQTSTAPPGESAPNTVLSQSPTAGQKVQSGTTVILTVLSPSAKYPLGSLSSETSVAAGAALATQGLTAGPVTRICSDTIRQGLVVATNPAAGSLVSQGQAITLELSSGPCTVFMPDVLNDTETVADQLLQSQGLTPSYSPDPTAVCEPGATPTVASQANSAGAPVKYGSTVNLTICQTPADTTTTTTTTLP
jgi:beta-lactam-binding protein with PASTA domain